MSGCLIVWLYGFIVGHLCGELFAWVVVCGVILFVWLCGCLCVDVLCTSGVCRCVYGWMCVRTHAIVFFAASLCCVYLYVHCMKVSTPVCIRIDVARWNTNI